MNPEDTNPFNNSGTDPLGGTGAMPGTGGLSMNDSLASAQDNLTSAGLAANDNSGVMGLDQIGASAPEAVMAPPVNEPLVPAAPVPGSIGSAISVPPLNPQEPQEPQPAVATEPAQPYNPFVPNPAAPAPAAGPAAPQNAPQNPFATPANGQPAPQPIDQPAPANQPVNPFAQPAVPQPTPAGMAPVQPMPGLSQPHDFKSSLKNPVTLISLLVAVALLVSTIVFAILWRQAADNTRIVYVPTVSEENKPQDVALTCTRALSPENIAESGDFNIASGENILSVMYHGDEIQGVNTATNLVYNAPEQAEAARADAENNWPALKELIGANDEILTVSYTAEGNVFRTEFKVTANDPTWVGNILGDLGVPAEDTDHTLGHVRSTAEANGYACTEE